MKLVTRTDNEGFSKKVEVEKVELTQNEKVVLVIVAYVIYRTVRGRRR